MKRSLLPKVSTCRSDDGRMFLVHVGSLKIKTTFIKGFRSTDSNLPVYAADFCGILLRNLQPNPPFHLTNEAKHFEH